ncbi:DUF2931 family protein [Marinobacter sp. AC-23]|uniref:DUF2931 family protein n=1 Tax=Marinobacter sp. AC-23 TaxID=1879031 RepID=UPI0008DCE4D0|nr:DUF2931 family protein [Marinobacter sp. AC-23]OHY72080.1 hypothetical protein BCA33_19380 [Marinobacter sp. AC-23]
MTVKTTTIATLMVLFLSGCASQPNNNIKEYIGVGAPQHYDVWVERFELETSSIRHSRMPMGSISCCWMGPNGPSGKGASTAPFPNYIAIQWFSFAEQKFYQKIFSLPKELERKMSEHVTYTTVMGAFSQPRKILTVGVAPGGQVVLWISNRPDNAIEVGRFQANEIEGDTSTYQVRTEEYLERSGDYIRQHGIPTDGW